MTETESRPRNRALVASFLFIDLVGYSKGTASDQYAAKATLSEILSRNLAALAKDDYRIKDTGDGALIAFLSNPEHALYMALAIAHDFARAAAVAGFPANSLRTGIHIGAVKEALDLEARPNFVGDGINAAKRIMDFAAPGQITASRAYFEAVSWLDSAYAALFQHLGASDDKHGRPHELYAIAPSDSVLEKLRLDLANTTADAVELDAKAPAGATAKKSDVPAATPIDSAGTQGRAAASARTWFVPIGALIAVALAAIFLMVWTQDPVGKAARPLESKAAPPALPAASPSAPASAARDGRAAGAPASAKPDAAGAPASSASAKPEPHFPPAVPPKPESATAVRASPDAESTAAPSSRSTSAARPSATNSADTQRRPAESPVPPAGASSARCRHILEKVQIGEPLSQDEKRELANSCR